MRLRITAAGDAPPALAWERYARPGMWSRWSPQVVGVDTAAPRIAPGVTGRVRGPLGASARFVVTAVDEDARTWSWRVSAGPVVVELDHAVADRPDGGTRTDLEVRGPAAAVLAYAPLARLALGRLVSP